MAPGAPGHYMVNDRLRRPSGFGNVSRSFSGYAKYPYFFHGFISNCGLSVGRSTGSFFTKLCIGMKVVFRPSYILKVIRSVVRPFSVFMVDLHSWRLWPYKCSRHDGMYRYRLLNWAGSTKCDVVISSRCQCKFDNLWRIFNTSESWGYSFQSSKARYFVEALKAYDWLPYFGVCHA